MYGQGVADSILGEMEANSAVGIQQRVLVYIDPDIDGWIAGQFLMTWLESKGIEYSWYVNDSRAHGFFLTDEEVEGYLGSGDNGEQRYIVHGDFTIEPEQLQHLVRSGITVLSTDHHEVDINRGTVYTVEGTQATGIIINNQYRFEREDRRYQSGAGVVLTVLRAYEEAHNGVEHWGGSSADALVGWTLLSDVRDISSKQAKWWLNKLFSWNYVTEEGYSSDEGEQFHKMLKHVVDCIEGLETFKTFGYPKINRNYVNFKMSPAINALFRFDLENEAVEILKGVEYPLSPVRGKTYQQLQRDVSNQMIREGYIEEFGKDFMILRVYNGSDGYFRYGRPQNFIGMACSALVNEYKKCVIGYVVGEDNKIIRASFRGLFNLDYRQELDDAGLLHGAGHGAAFGIPELVESKTSFEMIGQKITEIIGKKKADYLKNLARHQLECNNLQNFIKKGGKGEKVIQYNEYAPQGEGIILKYTGDAIQVTDVKEKIVRLTIDGIRVILFRNGTSLRVFDEVAEGNLENTELQVSVSRVGYDYILREAKNSQD